MIIINFIKTFFMFLATVGIMIAAEKEIKTNDSIDNMIIKTISGYILKRVDDYKY